MQLCLRQDKQKTILLKQQKAIENINTTLITGTYTFLLLIYSYILILLLILSEKYHLWYSKVIKVIKILNQQWVPLISVVWLLCMGIILDLLHGFIMVQLSFGLLSTDFYINHFRKIHWSHCPLDFLSLIFISTIYFRKFHWSHCWFILIWKREDSYSFPEIVLCLLFTKIKRNTERGLK